MDDVIRCFTPQLLRVRLRLSLELSAGMRVRAFDQSGRGARFACADVASRDIIEMMMITQYFGACFEPDPPLKMSSSLIWPEIHLFADVIMRAIMDASARRINCILHLVTVLWT